jgi:hypothetical protein
MRTYSFTIAVWALFAAVAAGQGFALWQVPTPLSSVDGFGRAVAVIEDVNADGIPDVAVGAPSVDSPIGPTPATYVLVLSGLTGTLIHGFVGPNATSHYGASVAGIGDLDGDGVGDLAIGAPGPGGQTSIGMVEVRSGATGAVLRTLTIVGSFGDRLGASVARIGDLDGDGFPDVLAGAPALGGIGRALAFSGANGAIIRTFVPPMSADELGDSVAGVGDVDGDQVPDVVVGAPGGTTPFNQFPGKAIVFSGGTAAALYTMTGNGPGDRFGVSAAALGDVNGDGLPDMVIGASITAQVGGGPQPQARAEIRSGLGGALILTLNPMSAATGAGFGFSVARASDQDGDGRSDVVVGHPLGKGRVSVFSSATGALLVTFEGSVNSQALGTSVASGDLNGDGLADFVAGAPGAGVFNPPGFVTAKSPIGLAPTTVRYGTACPGAGGCSAWLGGAFFQFGAPITLSLPAGVGGAGAGFIQAPVPLDVTLVGLTIYCEWAVLDALGPAGAVSVSDALAVTII